MIVVVPFPTEETWPAEETVATVTVASTTERVQVVAEPDLRTSVELAETKTTVEVVDDQRETVKVVEIPRSNQRVDVVVDSDGVVDTYVPKSIPVEERLDAIEKSSELLVADDVTSRTVEVSSIVLNKIEVTDLSAQDVDKAATATTLEERSSVSVDSIDEEERVVADVITEKEVTDIQVHETGNSATLLLADGSKIEVRISSTGEVVASDGRTVDITIKPSADESRKETDTGTQKERTKEPPRRDESLENKDINSDKEIQEKKEAISSDKEALERKQ